jgi:hypothetical protein
MFGTITSNIGGRVRVLKFNLNANYEFCKMHKLKQEDVMPFFTDALNVTAIRDMIYCALLSADLEDGKQIDYNQYTVGSWIAEMPQSELERIILGTGDANAVDTGKKKAKGKSA